jgi:hypothetical protein
MEAQVEVDQFNRFDALYGNPYKERITASILHDLVLAVGPGINMVRSYCF